VVLAWSVLVHWIILIELRVGDVGKLWLACRSSWMFFSFLYGCSEWRRLLFLNWYEQRRIGGGRGVMLQQHVEAIVLRKGVCLLGSETRGRTWWPGLGVGMCVRVGTIARARDALRLRGHFHLLLGGRAPRGRIIGTPKEGVVHAPEDVIDDRGALIHR